MRCLISQHSPTVKVFVSSLRSSNAASSCWEIRKRKHCEHFSLWNCLMSAAADARPQEWSWIDECWKLSLTSLDTHKHTQSHLLKCAHCLIMHVHTAAAYFGKLKSTLSVLAWRIHTFSHHGANDILSHTHTHTGMITLQHSSGSVGFSDWPTGQRCSSWMQDHMHVFFKYLQQV